MWGKAVLPPLLLQIIFLSCLRTAFIYGKITWGIWTHITCFLQNLQILYNWKDTSFLYHVTEEAICGRCLGKKKPKTKKWGFLFIRHAEMFWTFFPKITTSGLHLFVKFHGFSPLRVYLNHDDMNIVFQNDLNVLLLCVNNNVAERQ